MFGKGLMKAMGVPQVAMPQTGGIKGFAVAPGMTVYTGDVGDPWECYLKAENNIACSMAFTKLQQAATTDPQYLNNNADKYVQVLTLWIKKFNFVGERDPWACCLMTFTSLYNVTVIPKVSAENWQKILPCYVALLSKKDLPDMIKTSVGSIFSSFRTGNASMLFPISEMLLSSMFQNNIKEMAPIVTVLYPKQRKLVQQNVAMILSWAETGTYCLEVLDAVSLDAPEVLHPLMDRIQPFLSDQNNANFYQASNIFMNVAAHNPYILASKAKQIHDAFDGITLPQFSMMKITYIKILGLIGRTSKDKAVECMDILHTILQTERSNDIQSALLVEMKNIGGVFKSVLESKREDVKRSLTSPFEGVRSQAANILDYLDNKEINSLPTALAIQDAKIEQQAASLGDLRINQQEASRAVTNLTNVQQDQQRQISDLDRRVAEIKSANELIDAKMAEMKTFLAEVAKKLPVPAKFDVDGTLVKTIVLDFHCSVQRDEHCLHTKDHPFVTKTHEWGKWIKLSISAVKLGLAVYNKDAIGAVEGAVEIYEHLKDFQDPSFTKFLEQPFLTSAEQDQLITQLRDAKFFDVFKYDAQTAKWMCCNCSKSQPSQAQLREQAAMAANNGNLPSPKSGNGAVKTASKKHTFVRYHFHRFTWCVHCDNFIWGLGKQGYKCTTCKYRCHPECLQHVPDNCGEIDIKCHLSGKNARKV